MRRIWHSPKITYEWGEPSFLKGDEDSPPTAKLWCDMSVTFGATTVHSWQGVMPWFAEDGSVLKRFADFLADAKERAVQGSLREWDRFLLKPEVKEAEAAVLQSRSVREFPFFLDKTFDEGAPHDYVLYRDYVWTVDEEHRFEPDLWLAKECLEREWQRIEFSTTHSNGVQEVERPPIPESIRHEVWRRDCGQCAHCGSRERLEFDHIVPIAMGGSNTARNIELLCETCNRQKGASLSVR